jgi:hypothetical protein
MGPEAVLLLLRGLQASRKIRARLATAGGGGMGGQQQTELASAGYSASHGDKAKSSLMFNPSQVLVSNQSLNVRHTMQDLPTPHAQPAWSKAC